MFSVVLFQQSTVMLWGISHETQTQSLRIFNSNCCLQPISWLYNGSKQYPMVSIHNYCSETAADADEDHLIGSGNTFLGWRHTISITVTILHTFYLFIFKLCWIWNKRKRNRCTNSNFWIATPLKRSHVIRDGWVSIHRALIWFPFLLQTHI